MIAFAFYCIGALGEEIVPNVFSIWNAFKFMIFFWIGYYIRMSQGRSLHKVPVIAYVIGYVILFAVDRSMVSFSDPWINILEKFVCLFLRIAGALMAFMLLQRLAGALSWKNSKCFRFFNRRAMTVYLFHQQCIYFSIMLLNGKVSAGLNAVLNFIFSLTVSLLIGTILMRWRATRILVGEKN